MIPKLFNVRIYADLLWANSWSWKTVKLMIDLYNNRDCFHRDIYRLSVLHVVSSSVNFIQWLVFTHFHITSWSPLSCQRPLIHPTQHKQRKQMEHWATFTTINNSGTLKNSKPFDQAHTRSVPCRSVSLFGESNPGLPQSRTGNFKLTLSSLFLADKSGRLFRMSQRKPCKR